MLVSPCRNHSSSCTIERRCSFLVVTSGKPSRRSKRICQPNTLRVPVPVRSAFSAPCSRTWRSRSRYCFIDVSPPAPSATGCGCSVGALREQPQPDTGRARSAAAQHLAHRQPAEGEVAELRIGHAHELDEEAEHAVQQREQARHAIARPRLARVPATARRTSPALRARPGTAATDGARNASSAPLAKCAAQRVRRSRPRTPAPSGTPRPSRAWVGLPHSSPLMKLPMRPKPRPGGTSGAMKSIVSNKCSLRRRDHSHAATSTPSRPPWKLMPPSQTLKHLQRMRDVGGQVVEQDVAEAPAQHHAEHRRRTSGRR